MDAGLMRHRVIIQGQGAARNEFGEVDPDVWVDVACVRASINPLSGRELHVALSERSEITHKVTVRYNRELRATMRVVCGSRVFSILHIIDTWERHHEMVLMCKELVGCE